MRRDSLTRLFPLVVLSALPATRPQPLPSQSASATAPTAQQLYDSLPQAEREPFLAYELALGLERVAGSVTAVAQALSRDTALAGRGGSLADKLHHLYGIPADLLAKFQNLPTPSDFDINMYIWVKTSTQPTFEQMLQLAATGQYCVGTDCYSLQEPWGNCCPF